MKTGIPRDFQKVVEAAEALEYHYSHAKGGHHFYVKENPDKKLGQAKVLTIPHPKIKGTGTLRNILKGMKYFEANGLNKAGHPLSAKRDPAAEKRAAELAAHKLEGKFVNLTREWKKAMKSFVRHVSQERPGPAPMRKPANGNTPAPS